MKKTYKKMFVVCMVLVFVLACASTATAAKQQALGGSGIFNVKSGDKSITPLIENQAFLAANDGRISGADGSNAPRVSRYKAKSKVPLMGTLKMPHSFYPGVPTKAELTLKFWNAPFWVRINGVVKKKRTFDYFTRALVRPGLVNSVWSCRPPDGLINLNPGGTCDGEQYQPGSNALEPDLPSPDESWKQANFDVAQPYFDWSYVSKMAKRRWLKKNQSMKIKLWVVFPRCVILSAQEWARPKGVNWPCEPGSLFIGATYTMRGKGGWRGQGYMNFYSRKSMYIHQPPPPPVVEAPIGATATVEPTSPTGPSGPTS